MCVRFLGEMKTNPSCLFVALYGENDLPYAVERGLADAIIERDTLYCPAIRFLYEIETAASDQQTERNIQIWFLLYFFFTILIGEITRTLVINVAIPPSMFLILEGILIGWYVEGDHPGVHGISVLDQVNAINPFMLFYIFLPGLAFEAAYNMNIHIFRRSFLQIMSLSLPGVTLGTALLGILIHEILPYDWSWQTSFLLGCILVATDTVGQQRWFMDSDQPSLKKLGTLIDAECQLDSDFAIILFWALLNFKESETVTASVMAGESESLVIFLQAFGGSLLAVIGGGFAWGILFSIISFAWMYRRSHDTTGEATFSLSMSFLSCLCAELFHQSGLIAILTVGLFMNYHGIRLGRELMLEMKRFWDIVVHIVEALLFVTTGLVCYVRNHNIELDIYDLLSVVAIYVAIHVVRGVVVGLLGGCVSKVGYGLEVKEAAVLVWGGLTRGAVSLALSLCLASRPTDNAAAQKANALAVLFASVMTFMTVFVNGGTVKALTYKLGLVYTTPAKKYAVKTAWSRIEHETKHMMNAIASDSMYGDVDWDKVRAAVTLPKAESFYESDPWEDIEAISDLFLSPLGWASNMFAWITCREQQQASHVSLFGGALGLVAGVFDDPNKEKKKGKLRKKKGDSAAGDGATEDAGHPMKVADFAMQISRNKHVRSKLRSAQFRVETRKRMIQMERNSYLEQYDEGLLTRSAVMLLIQELEHQADHHRVLEANDAIRTIEPGCLRKALYSWQPGLFFKLLGFGVIRSFVVGSILNSMTDGWDACDAFCRAKMEVMLQLDDLNYGSGTIIAELKEDIRIQVQEVRKAQCLATAKYPDIMRGVKTKKITKQLLNKSLKLVYEQHEDQMLEKEDVMKLEKNINAKIDEVFNVSWQAFIKFDEDITMNGVLDTLAWVQGLTPTARTKLEQIAEERKYPPAANLVMRNERSTSIFIIVSGFAEHIDSNGQATQYCGAGTMLGERSVLTQSALQIDVRSVTDVTVCELPGEKLRKLMDEERSVEKGLWKMCGYRIAKRFLMPHEELQDDEMLVLDERESDAVSGGDSSLREVRDFLMSGSVVCVDEGENLQIESFTVMLYTEDPSNNGYLSVPAVLAPGSHLTARKKTYVYMDMDEATMAGVSDVPDDMDDMDDMDSDAPRPHMRPHTGLRKRGRISSRNTMGSSPSSPAIDYIHEHGSMATPNAKSSTILGREVGGRPGSPGSPSSPTMAELAAVSLEQQLEAQDQLAQLEQQQVENPIGNVRSLGGHEAQQLDFDVNSAVSDV
jgi:NhaP-type Na+/H+ or K+/H+ antiporter/CRP-like cAMP-binding protein